MKSSARFGKVSLLLIASVISTILFSKCKKSSESGPAASQICAQVTGTEAVYWDLMNGIPRTDIPGGLPTISTVGGTYSHPSYPLLTFIYPPGYTPQTDLNSGYIGVNLFRNDARSIWRYTAVFLSGNYSPQAVVASEIAALRNSFGSTGAVETVCSQQGTQPRATGITSDYSSAFIRFGDMSATVNVTITSQTGLGAEQISIMTTAAPTAEFANEILHTWLPIDYQMLYKDNGEVDSDGDGVADSIDAFPNDANRH